MDFKGFIDRSKKLRNEADGLYIYGAGLFGRDISAILRRHDVKVDGFLETDCKEPRKVWGLTVKALDSVIHDNIGIIIGMNVDNTLDAKQILADRGFPPERVINGGEYYAEDKMSRLLADNPLLEIGTVIGCPVNCRYCPQDIFINAYFKQNKKRQKMMTLQNFARILENTPDDCVMNFAALSEPFVNPDCAKMLRMACDAGRTVLLFSTFVGASDEDIDEVLKLPIHAITLHCADSKGYARIPTGGNYYERIGKILDAKKEDGSPMVVGISSQTVPTEEMERLCEGRHEIKYSLHDRLGVLKDSNLASLKEPHRGKFECSLCGAQVNSHVVCPDGTVILCNNDFAMRHVLGNIYEQTFDEMQNGPEIGQVLRGMNGDASIDLICRRCVCTHALE